MFKLVEVAGVEPAISGNREAYYIHNYILSNFFAMRLIVAMSRA